MERTIKQVEGGYVLTLQEQVGTKIISKEFLFNSLSEAKAYGASSFASVGA